MSTTLPPEKVREIEQEAAGMYPFRNLNAGPVEQERYDTIVKRDRQCYTLGATIEAKKAMEEQGKFAEWSCNEGWWFSPARDLWINGAVKQKTTPKLWEEYQAYLVSLNQNGQ